ncbi:hypothetical protein B0H67DRAFT_644285 [Lasiosphaeris hirsuta]|uniref:Tetratricopeptide repeat protein n=1 Tax=Lasiosphaeris hirsuta TaxID=260670 RepID=A0AA40ASE9_9PEZI|nr:hypothetical protein B0H67DRAFT_644285 [Lasiosphaeris hirsuta]
MTIKKQLVTEDSMPFEFATEYEDLAYVRLSQGRTQDALNLIQDAIQAAGNDEAASCSVLLQFIFDWAVILLNSGQFREALTKAQETFDGREKVLGPHAIHTLNSMYWIANALYHLGRPRESE